MSELVTNTYNQYVVLSESITDYWSRHDRRDVKYQSPKQESPSDELIELNKKFDEFIDNMIANFANEECTAQGLSDYSLDPAPFSLEKLNAHQTGIAPIPICKKLVGDERMPTISVQMSALRRFISKYKIVLNEYLGLENK